MKWPVACAIVMVIFGLLSYRAAVNEQWTSFTIYFCIEFVAACSMGEPE